jgi:hypothetical protein
MPISSSLYGSVRQLLAGRLVGHHTAREPLPALLDLLHLLLDGLEILGRERPLDVEVVVEAVLDRRADAQLGLGEQLLHGLRHDVRGGVAQDVQAVGGGDLDGLDLLPSFTSYARSLSSPATRAAMIERSPAKSSAAVVPVVTVRSSRSESRWMITRTSDTGLS